ncbi:hypothetical protein Hanom_Chr17g01587371 [Helianthus anomalus]
MTDGVLLRETLKDVKGLKKAPKVRSRRFKTLITLKIRLTSCGPDCDIVRKAIR